MAATQTVSANCPFCQARVAAVRPTTNHALHIVVVVITGGLWILPYLAFWLYDRRRPYRCRTCGTPATPVW